MTKTRFRITEVQEVTVDSGEISPHMLKQMFEEGKGMVGESQWGWWDLSDDLKTVEYKVEIVND